MKPLPYPSMERNEVRTVGMTRQVKKYVKKNLDTRRFRHTLGVRKTARKLAKRHLTFSSAKERRAFLKKVSLAALLHDADKQKEHGKLWKILEGEKDLRHEEIRHSKEIWHAFTSAVTARKLFGIRDPDVLDALKYHTTGRKGMSDLEKVIYLADYIEPGRNFPGVRKIRKAAGRSLDLGVLAALEHSIGHLQDKGSRISAYTLEARKDIEENGIF